MAIRAYQTASGPEQLRRSCAASGAADQEKPAAAELPPLPSASADNASPCSTRIRCDAKGQRTQQLRFACILGSLEGKASYTPQNLAFKAAVSAIRAQDNPCCCCQEEPPESSLERQDWKSCQYHVEPRATRQEHLLISKVRTCQKEECNEV